MQHQSVRASKMYKVQSEKENKCCSTMLFPLCKIYKENKVGGFALLCSFHFVRSTKYKVEGEQVLLFFVLSTLQDLQSTKWKVLLYFVLSTL